MVSQIIKLRCLIILYLATVMMSGCRNEPQFQPPIDPYGLAYRVGSLDGNPVNLGQGFSYLEYDDEDIWKRRSFWEIKPQKQRDYHSVIASFGFEFRYPDNLILTTYYKTPQLASQLYKKENEGADKFNSPWVDVGVHAGKYYVSGLEEGVAEQNILKLEPYPVQSELIYQDVVINTHKTIYGLEKYESHPEAIKKYGLEDIYATRDLYVERDNKRRMVSYISCDNNHNVQQCELNFNMLPELRVSMVARFRKSQLKNWQGIKESTKTIMRGLISNQIK